MSIMGASSKKASKPSSSKKSLLIIGGIFIAVLLLGFWYYQSQRPNYRDLEKEFSRLTIPNSWKQETYNTPGRVIFGFTCLSIDSECPIIATSFSTSSEDAKIIESEILTAFGNKVPVKSCRASTDRAGYQYCDFSYTNGSIKIYASIAVNDSKVPSREISIFIE